MRDHQSCRGDYVGHGLFPPEYTSLDTYAERLAWDLSRFGTAVKVATVCNPLYRLESRAESGYSEGAAHAKPSAGPFGSWLTLCLHCNLPPN